MGATRGFGGGGMGGGQLSSELISYLLAHQGSAKYLVAATGSQTRASIIIQTGRPVVTIGGFNGRTRPRRSAQLASSWRMGSCPTC